MKKWILFAFFAAVTTHGQITDPYLQSVLNELYLRKGFVHGSNLIAGTVTSDRFVTPLDLDPSQIIGIALTRLTVFSGPNISGLYNELEISGFYPSSNPSNYIDITDVLALNYIGCVDVPGCESDPSVTGKTSTIVWTNLATSLGPTQTITNVYSSGLLQSFTIDGVEQ